MAAEDSPRDGNFVPAALFQIDGEARGQLMAGQIDQSTGRILMDNAGGSGTVTDFSFTDANGFHGVVTNSTSTPNLTLSNTVNGIVKSDGTSMTAASSSTDYAAAAFKTIAVSGQSDVVADSPIDTLTLVQGANITITTNATTDTITIAASGSTGVATVTGTANRISIGGTATDPIIDIAATYVGQTSITTLGTIGTGTWNATAIADGKIASALTGKTYNGLTVTSTTGTLTITNLKTLSISNTLTFTGTDGSSVNFGAGGTVLYAASTIPLTVGSTTIASGTTTRILYDNAGVLGEYTVTGSGTTAVLSTSPTFTTSIITPLIVGGTGTTGTQLTIQTTSGNGTTDQMLFKGGNNGATTFATLKANSLDLGTSAALTTGTIEVGAASDTTISRDAAGQIAVEGVRVDTISGANALTNKTITSSTNVLGGVTMTLGSDANYDMYYRNSSGILTRLANGTTGQVLKATTSNAPSWGTASGTSFPNTQVFSGSAPTSMTDLDLSATVGAAARMVFFKAIFASGADIFFRVNGETATVVNQSSGTGNYNGNPNANEIAYFLMATDSSGIVEWFSPGGPTMTLVVIAYW